MPFNHGESSIGNEQEASATSPLQPMEQLSFPEYAPLPTRSPQAAQQHQYPASPTVTQVLESPSMSPSMTQSLEGPTTPPGAMRNGTEVQTGALTIAKPNTTVLRQPVLIRGSGKKSSGMMRPPKGKRMVVHIAATALLAIIVLITLIAVLPLGGEANGRGGFNLFKPIMDIVNTKGNNIGGGVIAAQAATATAVTQDGYDPGTGQVFAGLPTPPPAFGGDVGGLNRFFYGQCTYWANMRYHQLTGLWIPWLGNANQWYYGAQSTGWVVSATPKLHSIIVLQAGVQGAGGYGHVAIVEQINPDGSVLTSDYNWDGHWAQETSVPFSSGPGVSFVSAPGF